MTDFHKTKMGHQFYEHTVPELNRKLGGLQTALEAQNELAHEANQLKRRELDLLEAQFAAKNAEINKMKDPWHYNEITMYNNIDNGHDEFSYYVRTKKPILEIQEAVDALTPYIGHDGLEEGHLSNILFATRCSKAEFYEKSSAKPEANHHELNVTFEVDGSVSTLEIVNAVNQFLQKHRDDGDFSFSDDDAFIESIIVTAKSK